MQFVRVGAASINQTPFDWDGNKRRIVEAVEEASNKGVRILCLPELCLTGYGCEDVFLSPELHRRAFDLLYSLRGLGDFGMVTILGLPVAFGNAVYNCVAVIQDGQIRGIVPKQTLAGDGIHYEQRWFKAWPKGRVEKIGQVPFGDLIFETNSKVRFGFEICEDAWSYDRPGARLAHRGVDLIFNPSASHFAFGKQEVRRRFVVEGSRAYNTTYVYANLLGNESGRVIFDGSTIIASNGEVIQEGPRFSYKDHTLIYADTDIELLRMQRTSKRSFRPEDEVYERTSVVGLGAVCDDRKPEKQVVRLPEWETCRYVKQEEFTRAVSLGLFDYFRKSGVNGYVVSLSGGADSTAVAGLVATMIYYARTELSESQLDAKLPQMTPEDFTVSNLLTTVYQATKNSSDKTREIAQQVASDLGANHLVLDVDSIVESYKGIVGEACGVDWSWDEHDIELQNIQARARGPSAWMISNLLNSILLTTSNRSEASVGYATMDGDTCGALAPIAGIDKLFLKEWLFWLTTLHHPDRSHPMANACGDFKAISRVVHQPPTAELRPAEDEQTDEDDLMPYHILDAIERLFVRDKKFPQEIFELLRADYAEQGHEDQEFVEWIEKFFRLWCRNQWKRERYAISFHLDDENVDPKTGCRFPALSGGFRKELRELKKKVGMKD